MSYVNRPPRGQQRDKIYREALRLELADMSEGIDLKKLREIARTHIEKAAAGDMQAIKELADRLDGRPVPIPEHEFNKEGESSLASSGAPSVWSLERAKARAFARAGGCRAAVVSPT